MLERISTHAAQTHWKERAISTQFSKARAEHLLRHKRRLIHSITSQFSCWTFPPLYDTITTTTKNLDEIICEATTHTYKRIFIFTYLFNVLSLYLALSAYSLSFKSMCIRFWWIRDVTKYNERSKIKDLNIILTQASLM